jgi:hypothetical protein
MWFRSEQVADNAARSRRGGGKRPTGAGREDDSLPVEESEHGREINAAMMEYWGAFMRDGNFSCRYREAIMTRDRAEELLDRTLDFLVKLA